MLKVKKRFQEVHYVILSASVASNKFFLCLILKRFFAAQALVPDNTNLRGYGTTGKLHSRTG